MKLSVVIPVLDSHEIVRRQWLYWGRLNSYVDIEYLLVDDGSDVPVLGAKVHTNDKSPWSEHMATNLGVEEAKGDYILKTDIDHIITNDVIHEALKFKGDCLRYKNRNEGILSKDGYLVSSNMLRKPHSNTFVMKKSIFQLLGGYNEYGRGYDAGGSIDLWHRYMNYVNAGVIKNIEWSDKFIYVWPNSPITPMEDQHLFHGLRKTL
jgi:hypothetical protein